MPPTAPPLDDGNSGPPVADPPRTRAGTAKDAVAFEYSVTATARAREAVRSVAARMEASPEHRGRLVGTGGASATSQMTLRLCSMREAFDHALLGRFYDELMIPNFPLEEERDDLDDWIWCFDPALQKGRGEDDEDEDEKGEDESEDEDPTSLEPGPGMDVLLLIMVPHGGDGAGTAGDHGSPGPGDGRPPPYDSKTATILGGVVFDYFRNAQIGLLSYMVTSENFRRLGILKALHPVACHAMRAMHRIVSSSLAISSCPLSAAARSPAIKAILAETNTVDAGDASRETIQKRHEILHRLGYRHLKFPYVQPPLGEDEDSFDEIMLLVHVGEDDGGEDGDDRADRPTTTGGHATAIDTGILHDYVVDFFRTVTGYGDSSDRFEGHWYYQLAAWFARRNPTTEIAAGLPWDDVTDDHRREMELEQQQQQLQGRQLLRTPRAVRPSRPTDGTGAPRIRDGGGVEQPLPPPPSEEVQERRVVVVGAGIAGLVATVTVAEEYLRHRRGGGPAPHPPLLPPLCITLVEAHPFVGGRIRTVVTDPEAAARHDESPLLFSNGYLHANQDVSAFAPWPVPIGAEFVHGVGSMVTELIQQNEGWPVQETFDLCSTTDDYPSGHGFVQRRNTVALPPEQRRDPHVQIFLGGECHPVRHGFFETRTEDDAGPGTEKGARTRRLIRRAQQVWQTVQAVRDQVYATAAGGGSGGGVDARETPQDMSLEQFIREQLAKDPTLTREDVEVVEQILESMFSNTWSSSNKCLGVHESSREEWNWDYTQSNFRTEQCFNELLGYYLKRIDTINQEQESLICITVETNHPITEIGSFPEREAARRRPVRVTAQSGKDMECDKCIVTIPLAALKAQKVSFQGEYLLPDDKQYAIDTIEMFSGMKAHMLLKVGVDITAQSKLMKTTEIFFCPGTLFSQVWLRRNEDTVFLTGFCLANCRDTLVSLATDRGVSKDEFARVSMLEQLQRMFEPSEGEKHVFVDAAAPTCSAFALHDWSDDEYVLGAYSSPSVGAGWQMSEVGTDDGIGTYSLTTCRDVLNTPIKDAVWLAGEHVCSKTSATVQSAMESGKLAAKAVVSSLIEAKAE